MCPECGRAMESSRPKLAKPKRCSKSSPKKYIPRIGQLAATAAKAATTGSADSSSEAPGRAGWDDALTSGLDCSSLSGARLTGHDRGGGTPAALLRLLPLLA